MVAMASSLTTPSASSPRTHLSSSYSQACSPPFPFLHLHLQPSYLSSSCCSRGHGTCVAMATSSSSIQDLLLSPRVGSTSNDSNFASSLFGSLTDVISPPEPKPAIECPPGLCRYETMAVLRPDITEQQRLELTQRYEEAIVAGGGMGVEIFNRGMMPLTYSIRHKDTSGTISKYLDGVFFLFTYCTKPESVSSLDRKFRDDDDVIRSTTVKVKPPRPST